MKQLQVLNSSCNEDIFAKLFTVLTIRVQINFIQSDYAEFLEKSTFEGKTSNLFKCLKK